MTVTDHTLAIRNVTIDSLNVGLDSQRFALAWELRDARYHIWFDDPADLDPDTKHLTAADFILYKNPPRGLDRNDPNNYWTRQLNPAAKTNVRHVEAARRVAIGDNLYQIAVKNIEDAQELVRKATAEKAHEQRIKSAGPVLLDALKLAHATIMRLTCIDDAKRASVRGTLDVITEATAEAEDAS